MAEGACDAGALWALLPTLTLGVSHSLLRRITPTASQPSRAWLLSALPRHARRRRLQERLPCSRAFCLRPAF